MHQDFGEQLRVIQASLATEPTPDVTTTDGLVVALAHSMTVAAAAQMARGLDADRAPAEVVASLPMALSFLLAVMLAAYGRAGDMVLARSMLDEVWWAFKALKGQSPVPSLRADH